MGVHTRPNNIRASHLYMYMSITKQSWAHPYTMHLASHKTPLHGVNTFGITLKTNMVYESQQEGEKTLQPLLISEFESQPKSGD